MHGSRFNQPDVAVTSHAITGRSGRVTGGVNRFVDTARLLSELLMRRPEYCQRWQRRIQRGAATTSLSRAAVARVIAEYLWDTGERAETCDSLPRGIKDRVGRALDGTVLSAETLRWFVDAFAITDPDATRLWAAHSGARPPELLAGPRHRTVAVFERHQVDRDGLATGHWTTQAITATTAPMDTYLHVSQRDGVEVSVDHGGQLGRRLPLGQGLAATEILLTRPVPRGETTSLRYRDRYFNRAARASEYRRYADGPAENIDLLVAFDPARRPSLVWWTLWGDDPDGQIVAEEPTELDAECTAHRFLSSVERAVVGFRWAW